MRNFILSCTICLAATPASAELVRALDQDAETGAWRMTVPGWSATMAVESMDDMTATLTLRAEATAPMDAQVDMMGSNLPSLLNVEEVLLCSEQPDIVVTLADLTPAGDHGTYAYRRLVFSPDDGFLGEAADEASQSARGALPASLIADDLLSLCGTPR